MDDELIDVLHDLNLSNNLLNFYLNNCLCDVVILVDNDEIQAHKIVLASSSLYFRTLFTTDVGVDEEKSVIDLTEYESSVVEAVVNYLYSGKIMLTWENVFEVMRLEELLQVWNLRYILTSYLRAAVTKANCWEIQVKADFYNYFSLGDHVFVFILEKFKSLITEPKFLEVPYYLLKRCLDSPVLHVPTEGVLLCNLISWVMADFENREAFLEELLDYVDPRQIVSWNDSVTVTTKLTEGTRAAPIVSAWLTQAHVYRASYDGHINRKYKELLSDSLFAVGGVKSDGTPISSMEVTTNVSVAPWRLLLPMSNSTSAVSHHLDLELPPLPTPRFSHAHASAVFSFYIIGGIAGDDCLPNVDRYNVVSNTWSKQPSLPFPICRGAAVYLDSSVYLSGGQDEKLNTLNSLFVLRENGSRWMELTPMKEARCYHGLVAVNGALYAIGGADKDGRLLNSVERYDPLIDSWLPVAPLLLPRKRFCSASSDNYIFVVRGEVSDSSNGFNERYDTRTNKWRRWKSPDVCRPSYGGLINRKLAVVSDTSGMSVNIHSTVSETVHDGGPSLHMVRHYGSIVSLKIPLYKKGPY